MGKRKWGCDILPTYPHFSHIMWRVKRKHENNESWQCLMPFLCKIQGEDFHSLILKNVIYSENQTFDLSPHQDT